MIPGYEDPIMQMASENTNMEVIDLGAFMENPAMMTPSPDPLLDAEGLLTYTPMPGQNTTPPIAVNNEDLGALETLIRRNIDAARTERSYLDEKIKRYRGYVTLNHEMAYPGKRAYEGAPKIVTPLTRTKVDGVVSQLAKSLDLDPWFIAKPYSVEASRVSPVWEAMMEQQIDKSKARMQFYAAIREAAITGTGVLKFQASENDAGEFIIETKAVRFEDFYAYPSGVTQVERAQTFERFFMTKNEMLDYAEAGIYDGQTVENLRNTVVEPTISVEHEARKLGNNNNLDDDSQLHELYECWVKYKRELYHITYSYDGHKILRAQPTPYRFQSPPYVLLHLMPVVGSIYGDSMPQVLEPLQNTADFTISSHLAYSQFTLSPVILARQNSAVWQSLQKGWHPGKVIPVVSTQDNGDLRVLQLPPNPVAFQDLREIEAQAEKATFFDVQSIGAPLASRRTATELNIVTSIGNIRVATMMAVLREGLINAANMLWELISQYIIEPEGLVEVYKKEGSKSVVYKIAAEEVLLPDGTLIPGPRRRPSDIQWAINGANTIPEKLLRRQGLETALQGALGNLLIGQGMVLARHDKYVYNLVRKTLETLDIADWRDLLPPEPETDFEEWQKAEQARQMQEQMMMQQQMAMQGGQPGQQPPAPGGGQ